MPGRSFAEATDSLEQNHKGLVSLIGQNQALKGNLASLRDQLARIGREKKQTETEKQKYREQVDILTGRLNDTEERNQALVSELKETGSELGQRARRQKHGPRKSREDEQPRRRA